MKSDRPTAAIVAALRARGCDVVYVSSDTEKGVPDLVVATPAGLWTWLEVKDPDGAGDCGCTHVSRGVCEKTLVSMTSAATAVDWCSCKGHTGQGNSMRKTRHAQLAWAERHPCMRVVVVHSVDEALRACWLP